MNEHTQTHSVSMWAAELSYKCSKNKLQSTRELAIQLTLFNSASVLLPIFPPVHWHATCVLCTSVIHFLFSCSNYLSLHCLITTICNNDLFVFSRITFNLQEFVETNFEPLPRCKPNRHVYKVYTEILCGKVQMMSIFRTSKVVPE